MRKRLYESLFQTFFAEVPASRFAYSAEEESAIVESNPDRYRKGYDTSVGQRHCQHESQRFRQEIGFP